MAMTFTLGEKWEEFLNRKVQSGDFNNKSEVIRAGLRMLEQEEIRAELRKRIAAMDAGQFDTLEAFNQKIGSFLNSQGVTGHDAED